MGGRQQPRALRPTRRQRYRVTIFGSARTDPDHWAYAAVRDLGAELTRLDCDIITGGGPGLMQAANEGASRAGADPDRGSVGIRVDLPFEQDVNPFVGQAFEHRTFFSRLHHFVLVSDAFVVVPGGIGTVLETMMIWQLLQVRKLHDTPLILAGAMWPELIEWARRSMLRPDGPLASPEDFAIPTCCRTGPESSTSSARITAVGKRTRRPYRARLEPERLIPRRPTPVQQPGNPSRRSRITARVSRCPHLSSRRNNSMATSTDGTGTAPEAASPAGSVRPATDDTLPPAVALLSNGAYRVMITAAGAGSAPAGPGCDPLAGGRHPGLLGPIRYVRDRTAGLVRRASAAVPGSRRRESRSTPTGRVPTPGRRHRDLLGRLRGAGSRCRSCEW